MTVVSSDHQAIFSSLPDDVGQVIRIFASHKHAVLARKIFGPFATEGIEAILRFVYYPGQPLGAGLNEAETQLGKDLMYFLRRMSLKAATVGILKRCKVPATLTGWS